MIRHIKENTYGEHMNFMSLTMIDPIHKKKQINYKLYCLGIVEHYVLAGFGPKRSSIGLILKFIDS